MKKITSWVALVLVTFLVFLQGCAIDKPFVKKDLMTISPLKVVRQKTPDIKVQSVSRGMASAAVGGLFLGALGAGIAVEATKGKLGEETPYLDFGKLVMDKFVERVSKEIPNWPEMTWEEQPVAEDYAESITLIKFKVDSLFLGWLGAIYGGNAFKSKTVVIMEDSKGDVLCKKSFTYHSGKFNRNRGMKEFLADNGKLLKEEIEFAAEKTVSDFIEHFKREGTK